MRSDPGQGPGDGPGESWAVALDDLARACARAEEALFATVPVLGDPVTQRRVDGVVDQGVDVLRARADLAVEIAQRHVVAGGASTAHAARPEVTPSHDARESDARARPR